MKKAIAEATKLAHQEMDASLESEGHLHEPLNTAIEDTVIELALPIASPPDDPILAVGSSSYQVLAETEPDHEDVANDVHE